LIDIDIDIDNSSDITLTLQQSESDNLLCKKQTNFLLIMLILLTSTPNMEAQYCILRPTGDNILWK